MELAHATRSRIRTNDVELEVFQGGPESGPLVILLHGFPETALSWRKQVSRLVESGFRVVLPNQRGYAGSDKPEALPAYHIDRLAEDVVALAASMTSDPIRLIGHDWGGLVAWWVATRHPELVERLAIVNAPHPAITKSFLLRHPSQILKSSYIGFFQMPLLPEALLSADRFKFLRDVLLRTSRRGTFSTQDLDHYVDAWSEPRALTGMLNWYRALRLFNSKTADSRVTCPTLVFWGERDSFLDSRLATESLKLCTHGQVKWFRNGTHWVHQELSDEFNQELINFLR